MTPDNFSVARRVDPLAMVTPDADPDAIMASPPRVLPDIFWPDFRMEPAVKLISFVVEVIASTVAVPPRTVSFPMMDVAPREDPCFKMESAVVSILSVNWMPIMLWPVVKPAARREFSDSMDPAAMMESCEVKVLPSSSRSLLKATASPPLTSVIMISADPV